MKIGVIFDLDGTLLDTLQDIADAVNHTLRRYGLPERTGEEIRRFTGNGAKVLVQKSLPGTGGDPDLQMFLDAYKAYYDAHCQIKTKPYGGIEWALAQLGKKYPLAVVSNKPDSAVKLLCEQYFPGVYALGEAADCPRKPAPDMVHKAMKAIGVEACVYVGDSEVDVITAKNAGMPCLSVLWGFRDKGDMEAVGGKYFCTETAQMPCIIDRMIGEIYGQ